ncbi:sulfatase-like hydrolase/transferase [Altericroceibacterium endophyticum]|uniref:Sulfatase-like hydrolase/transferase n=1 Tax=Altericroceibacterium endophyticum TaxID=1808508 RepID=A0A6I4T7I8_9SPHN|nr:sulfatase-like hydrolase/transferase [Altericroceibacterium endophyticum]MXO66429.1 sulfatase-like hydrolase/transferase [Altericroceibacterium endophyticum]
MAAFSMVAAPAHAAEEPADHPNIALIILDDIGTDTASDMYPGLIDQLEDMYGPSGRNHADYAKIKGAPASTPVLDHFAAQGMTFSEAWAQPFCSPSRASILTGLYASKTGVRDYTNWLTQDSHSIALDLKHAGYSTAIFGKWHLAGLNQYPGMKPKQASFDLFRGNMNGAIEGYWDYTYQVQDQNSKADQVRDEAAPANALPGIKSTTYAPVTKIADAIDWINDREADDPDKPWFVWMAYNLSHITSKMGAPTVVPNEDALDEASRKEMIACGGQFGTANVGNCSAEAMNRAMTNSMDTTIGKLLDFIDKTDPNTYVIIVGDNGTPMYGPEFINFIDNMYITRVGRGKGTGYESGMRVPLAIRGPGIEPGTTSAAYLHVADLFSTILDLAKAPVPENVSNREGTGMVTLDARSLAPVLFGEEANVRDPVHDYIVSETAVPILEDLTPTGELSKYQVAVRNATYKVLCTEKQGSTNCEFYNLVTDPIEEYPLTAPTSCPKQLNRNFAADDQAANFCFLRQAVREQADI